MHHLRTLLIALLLCGTLHAQQRDSRNYYVKNYSVEDGLSQSMVYCILQDSKGFMWFGTQDGLNRFDGQQFKIYKSDSSRQGSIGDNGLFCAYEHSDGKLYFGCSDGVYIYDPRLDSFIHFDTVSNDGLKIEGTTRQILRDPQDRIWLSVDKLGLFCYDGVLTHYPLELEGAIRDFKLDKQGNIYLASYEQGLQYFIPSSKELQQIDSLLEYNCIYTLNDNTLLLGTVSRGVQQFDISSKTLTPLIEKDKDGNYLFIRRIIRALNGEFWLGSESGIYVYNYTTGQTLNLRHSFNDPFSLSDNAVHSLYQDCDGGIWAGTYFGGVNYIESSHSVFEKFYPSPGKNSISGKSISEFCEDPHGNIWIGTEDAGLNRYKPSTGTFSSGFIPATNIHALLSEGSNLWVGTFSDGLYRLNSLNGRASEHITSRQSGLHNNNIYALYSAPNSELWIGTSAGLQIYNKSTRKFRTIEQINSQVNDICYDGRGIIWIASSGDGILSYDIVANRWKRYPILCESASSFNALSLLCDSQGRIWAGVKGKTGGLVIFDREQDCFSLILSDTLPNDVIYKIVEDKHGMIWGSTNKGLFSFSPDNLVIHSFTSKQGLLGDQFNYKSGLRASDGKLYFGGIKGFISFYPENIGSGKEQVKHRLVFNGFQIFNDEVEVLSGKKSILTQSITYTKDIRIPFHHSSFSLSFADLQYATNTTHSYAYMLKGWDEEWIYCDTPISINYSKLKPGKYTLLVSTVDEDGRRDDYSIRMGIRIMPPFYACSIAYILYVLLILSIAYFVYKRWRKISRNRNEAIHKELEAVKEKELYNAKLEFFTNIAHEIRTPLSLIKLPLDEVLKQKGLDGDSYDNLTIMKHNTDRIIKLVGELLDFRKAETEGVKISFVHTNVVELIKETIERFRPAAEVKNAVIGFQGPDKLMADVDKELFTKILSNIVNNALKHTSSFISIELSTSDNKFYISVTNDGDVIPAEYTEKIFTPYFKIDEKSQGSGIGLPFALKLAQLHNGSISLDQVHTKHTCFVIDLPITQPGAFDFSSNTSDSPEIAEKEEDQIEKELKVVKKTTILFAEDNEDFLNFLTKQHFADYTILRATNGKEALSILQEHKGGVDMVITDLMMPIMDGMELSRKIREDLRYSHIPIIVLTAKTNIQTKMECMNIGIDDYIEKPFSADFLKARVENLISNRKTIANSLNNSPEVPLNSIAHSSQDKQFIAEVVKIINEHIEETDLNVDMIAGAMNMSRATFYRKVKSISQLTPNDFIRLTRLKRAAELLKQNDYRVNEIAYIVGFSSSSYFSKCFQKQFGVLPKKYASMYRS